MIQASKKHQEIQEDSNEKIAVQTKNYLLVRPHNQREISQSNRVSPINHLQQAS
jgi:hypothetical protein